MTGIAPVEVHVARTETRTGLFFNIFDVFRRILGMTDGKATCGC